MVLEFISNPLVPVTVILQGYQTYHPPLLPPVDCLQPILVAYINPAADGPDFRLKMVAQYHIKKAGVPAGSGDAAACWQYAEACSWDPVRQVRIAWSTHQYRSH